MKLFALYPDIQIPNLEYNHKKYCDKHGIEYNKIILTHSETFESQKLARVCEALEQNLGEICWFIDNYSYFQNFEILPDIDKDIVLQKYTNGNLDLSFFIVKSNVSTLNTFIKFRKNVTLSQIENKEISNNRDYVHEKFLNDFEAQCFPTIAKKTNDLIYYFNANLTYKDLSNFINVLSINVKSSEEIKFLPYNGMYCAEYMCLGRNNKKVYNTSKENFEKFNEGMPNALVTLYTEEVSNCGVISENNFKSYCKDNNITLYVYRKLPDVVENKKISGAWCKPFILLNHFHQHEALAWIDSDIIIGKNYKINFKEDISVYQDVGNWHFNSGFMVFKKTEANKNLLLKVAETIKDVNKDVSSTYVGGGDQAVFIQHYMNIYPEKIPFSYFSGNIHPFVPYPIPPAEKENYLVHFMGLPLHIRVLLMKAFDSERV